jgi:hypothetical protein
MSSGLDNRFDQVKRVMLNRGFLLSGNLPPLFNKNGKDAVMSLVTGYAEIERKFPEPWIVSGLNRVASKMPLGSHSMVVMHFADDVCGVGIIDKETDGRLEMLNLVVMVSTDGEHKARARAFRDTWLGHPEWFPKEKSNFTKPYRTAKGFEMLAELQELEEVEA